MVKRKIPSPRRDSNPRTPIVHPVDRRWYLNMYLRTLFKGGNNRQMNASSQFRYISRFKCWSTDGKSTNLKTQLFCYISLIVDRIEKCCNELCRS